MGYPLSTKLRAFRLYAEQGLTFEAVADRVGVSLSQLKAWAEEADWSGKKAQIKHDQYDSITGFWALAAEKVRDAQRTGAWKDISAALGMMKIAPKLESSSTIDLPQLYLDFLNKQTHWLEVHNPEALRHLSPSLRSLAEHFKVEAA